ERHSWHRNLLRIAKESGLKTVCIPNWEWFEGRAPQWQYCDLFVCQSQFTLEIVRKFGWQNTTYIPVAIYLPRFPPRRVSGVGRLFIHNAGLVDIDDRKGTRDTILAFRRVKRDDIRLVVRIQKPAPLPELDERIQVIVGNLTAPAELYATG